MGFVIKVVCKRPGREVSRLLRLLSQSLFVEGRSFLGLEVDVGPFIKTALCCVGC